jgi:hypothetical protein
MHLFEKFSEIVFVFFFRSQILLELFFPSHHSSSFTIDHSYYILQFSNNMRVKLIWNDFGIVMPIPQRLKQEKLSKLLQEAAVRFKQQIGSFDEVCDNFLTFFYHESIPLSHSISCTHCSYFPLKLLQKNRFVEITTRDGCLFNLNDTIEEVIQDDDTLVLVDYISWIAKVEPYVGFLFLFLLLEIVSD